MSTYYVKVKPGHPTGVRRRSGLTFTQDESMISEDAMTDAIRKDAWLQVRVVGEPLTPSVSVVGSAQKDEEEDGQAASGAEDVADETSSRRGRKKNV